jgi:hypothetical protein
MDAELEAKLIEQEHRIVRVIQNFVNRNQWANEDPRRAAAKNALVWRALAPISITAAAGSTVALATLLVLFWQTRLMSEQNASFKEQNAKLQAQIDLQTEQDAARRRTEVIANLYETVGDPLSPVSAAARKRANTAGIRVRVRAP